MFIVGWVNLLWAEADYSIKDSHVVEVKSVFRSYLPPTNVWILRAPARVASQSKVSIFPIYAKARFQNMPPRTQIFGDFSWIRSITIRYLSRNDPKFDKGRDFKRQIAGGHPLLDPAELIIPDCLSRRGVLCFCVFKRQGEQPPQNLFALFPAVWVIVLRNWYLGTVDTCGAIPYPLYGRIGRRARVGGLNRHTDTLDVTRWRYAG